MGGNTYLGAKVLDELVRRESGRLGALADAPLEEHPRDLVADLAPRVRAVLADEEALAAVRDGVARLRHGLVDDGEQLGGCGRAVSVG